MPSQRDVSDLGGTMRLGAYTARLRPGSQAAQAYGVTEISERHRHRWEVSNAYRDVLAEYGLRLSGQSPDGGLVEMIELPDHPWFIGCQFHPELKSRPTRPHPLFAGFIGAALRRRRGGGAARRPQELAESGALMGWSFARTPFLIAGPCVVEPGDVLPAGGRAAGPLGADAGRPGLLQGQLRQGQPRPRRVAARARAWTRACARSSGSGATSGLPVLTDIHEPEQAAPAAEVVDVLQIPPSSAGRPISSWPRAAPAAGQREEGAVDAARGDGRRGGEGARGAAAPGGRHRAGHLLRLRRLVVDMRNFARLRAATGAPVVFDATHAVQRPGQGAAGASGGRPRAHPARCSPPRRWRAPTASFSRPIPIPARALSDAATQWPLDRLDELLERTLDLWGRARA